MAAAVVLVVVALSVSYLREETTRRDGGSPRWSARLVAFAERSPRLLVGAEGWTIVQAEEYSATAGEVFFSNDLEAERAGMAPGQYQIGLNWYAADRHDYYVRDREQGADGSFTTRIAGHEARVLMHESTVGRTFYALWVDGEHALELRSDVVPTAEEFKALAASVRSVDHDTWLAAMPTGVVTPEERRDAVDRILADIPVPMNVDIHALKDRDTVTNSLEYEVTSAVACGWVHQWVDAGASGDTTAQREAATALAGARQWDVFQDAPPYGFESYLFEVADAMAAERPVNDSYPQDRVGVGYLRHIGCAEETS